MSLTATSSPVVGGTYQFLLPASLNNAPWNISGGTVTVTFSRPDGSEFTVSGSVIGAPAAYTALGYTTIGQYVTLTTDLNQYGTWNIFWEVTLGSITAPFGPVVFTVRRAGYPPSLAPGPARLGYALFSYAGEYQQGLYSVAQTSSGQLLFAGTLTTSGGGQNNMILSRWSAVGVLDTTFQGGLYVVPSYPGSTQDAGLAIKVQSDGKILLGGYVSPAGPPILAVLRLNADGSPDTGFGVNGYATVDPFGTGAEVTSIAVQTDGKIVAAGFTFNADSSLFLFVIARFTTAGVLDSGFGTGGIVSFDFGKGGGNEAYQVALQSDSKIIVVGSANNADFSAIYLAVARLTTAGVLDSTFATGGLYSVNSPDGSCSGGSSVAIDASGNIVAGGGSNVDGAGNAQSQMLIRLTPSAVLDTTFGVAGFIYGATTLAGVTPIRTVNDIFIDSAGKILAVSSAKFNTEPLPIARYTSSGVLDTTYGSSGVFSLPAFSDGTAVTLHTGNSAIMLSDGALVLAGTKGAGSSELTLIAVKITPTGTLDLTFGDL